MAQTKIKISPADLSKLQASAELNEVVLQGATKYNDDLLVISLKYKIPSQLFLLGRDLDNMKVSLAPETAAASTHKPVAKVAAPKQKQKAK